MVRYSFGRTRRGLYLAWAADTRTGVAALFVVERRGREVSSKRLLWGDPAKWNEAAQRKLSWLLDQKPESLPGGLRGPEDLSRLMDDGKVYAAPPLSWIGLGSDGTRWRVRLDPNDSGRPGRPPRQ